jgi:putative tryptophan/tyrosine transport system substrate-binding protein
VNRRTFITSVGAGFFVAPFVAEAQSRAGMARIGILTSQSPPGRGAGFVEFDAFVQAMRDLGYVLGQNLLIELRAAEGQPTRFPALAAELVDLKVDVIFAPSTPAVQAAKRATMTIPIVFAVAIDPVGDRLIASLARPGGNITGITSTALELAAKRLELLREALPGVRKIGVLAYPGFASAARALVAMQEAARTLGVQIQPVEAREDQFDAAFAELSRDRASALVVLPHGTYFRDRKVLADLAAKNRLPTMNEFRPYVDAGGLMSYGADVLDLYRHAARYIDRILKGAKPSELPVEQPTKFELVINAKTAKALGLTIPQSLLLRADQVIE